MTKGALFAIGSLSTWSCWYLVAQSLYFAFVLWLKPLGFNRIKSTNMLIGSACGAVVLFVAGFGLLKAVPASGAETAGISLPVFWPVFPFALWAAIICVCMFAVRGYQLMLAALPPEKKARAFQAGLWLVALAVFFGTFKLSGDTAEFAIGRIGLKVSTAITLGLLAVLAVFGMVFAAKAAIFRNWSKTLVVHTALVIGSIIFGLPFFWLVLTSFKEEIDMSSPNGGLVWTPKVAQTAPFEDPKHNLYETTFQGHPVEGEIVRKLPDGNAEVEVIHPISLRGYTTITPLAGLKPTVNRVPVVTGSYKGEKFTGRVIEEMDDGHRRVLIDTPAKLMGTTYVASPTEVEAVRTLGLRWANYSEALEFLPVETNSGLVYLQNTLIIVVLSVIGTILSSSIVAYAFSRMRFPGQQALFGILISTMMLPGAVTLLPTFLIYKKLGWVDTLLPLWVPAFFGSAFNVFLLRQFFKNIPLELEDAAKVDGCSYLKTFWTVMIPQIKPALAVIGIWTFLAAWNNFLGPLIYINSPEKMPLSYAVQIFASARQTDPGLTMAFATMSMVPVLLLFFFAQRYFIEGVTLSGLGGK